MPPQVSDEQIEELRWHFSTFDLNASGWIEEDDLKQALAIIGQPKDNYQVRKLLQSIDTDTDGRLSFDEYIGWNRQLFIDDMKMKFQEMDADGNGILTKAEIKKNAMEWNYGVTEEELDEMTYQMDANQDDKIGIEEFISAMATKKTGQAYYVINGELYSAKLQADFNAIDADGSGFVVKEELRNMAKNLSYAISEQELNAIMDDMDDDKDGKISLQEFIAATVKIKVHES